MFSFPLWAFLVVYAIFLVVFLIFSFANAYHLYATGTFTTAAFFVTLLVSAWCLIILATTYNATAAIDWNESAIFFGPGGTLVFQ